MKNISIIVAIDQKNGIGLNNDMLIYISNDLKRFKQITNGHTVIMGRRTWESLPKRPLPNRTNIIITKQKNFVADGAIIANSIEDAIKQCPTDDEVFIMGGANIYEQFMPIAQKIYLTQIHKTFKADVFFPSINKEEWQIINKTDINDDEKANVKYSFIDLVRKE